MIFRVPIYVAAGPGGSFSARPLFFAQPERTDTNLNRLISKLARDVVKTIENLGKEDRQDDCARWTFAPDLTQHRHQVAVELRRRTVKVKLLFVAFKHLAKRLAFTPAVPDLWFEVGRGEGLHARATDVLTDHWRARERDDEEVHPEAVSLPGKAWVQTLTLSASPAVLRPKKPEFKFLSLGDDRPIDGAAELQRVGHCLDWLYPDELDRALLRDAEVDELFRLLAAPDQRPVLLVGPRQCGKTTILHEVVYRRVADRKSPFVNRDCTWLLSPQRLISGMSYVGQWENRLLGILGHAKKKHHVLYFDDLVGLFVAGVSASSTLSAAQVLKPYLERRDVRIVGEITPEGLRVLQERDRSFADLFHVLPVREPSDAGTLRVLIGVQRRLEGKFRCGFDVDALPAVIDLQRRYERTAAFPGKAARMLTRLAVKADADRATSEKSDDKPDPYTPAVTVTRDGVLAEFRAQSGLSVQFLDRRARLDREDILEALRAQVIGQDEAVEAAADVIAVAKARLNDPDRPLAAFLFLGPTGVGKTETAKAVARYLFGDADRLVRFDMNEYVNPGAAARLVGTFDQPEGLLTAAIRRQPFAVVLLDEIEKADPEVFDLLLQVLGEGRLTDALGRTADFTNALIILTSNLGVRESEARVGFADGGAAAAASYVRAAERFFRPEFFNRLDRVLPFRRLSREHTRTIAARLVDDVLNREGFRQRKCVLNVTPAALERVIDAGYDPVLGARAMKRAVERQLTHPAAARLAGLPVDRFTVVNVHAAGEGATAAAGDELVVDIRALEFVAPIPPRSVENQAPLDQLEALEAELEAVEATFAHLRPAGPVSRRVTVDQERYFVLRELADRIGEEMDRLFDRYESDRVSRLETRQPDALGRKSRYRVIKVRLRGTFPAAGIAQPDRSLMAAQSMEEALRDLADTAEPEPGDADLIDLGRRLALLRLMATAPPDDRPTYLWLRGHPAGAPCPSVEQLAAIYLKGWNAEIGVEVVRERPPGVAAPDALLLVRGIHARPLATTEAGTHLFCPAHGNVVPVRADVLVGWPAAPADPFAFGPILRTYVVGGSTLDHRTGLVALTAGVDDALRTMTLAAL
ncbi:MAG TPA: AAA family ATPase [Gemmataceae bacterium]|nr:AAA family ATPase [Gemmataceae bacterium]